MSMEELLLTFHQAAVEVEPLEPTYPPLKETIASMEERGISLLYGRWLIEGAPRVLLVDTSTGYRWLDEWKGDLWAAAGIPSPAGDSETNEAIVFGYLVAWFLGEVSYPLPRWETREIDEASSLPKNNPGQ
jgi:glycogen synthase